MDGCDYKHGKKNYIFPNVIRENVKTFSMNSRDIINPDNYQEVTLNELYRIYLFGYVNHF